MVRNMVRLSGSLGSPQKASMQSASVYYIISMWGCTPIQNDDDLKRDMEVPFKSAAIGIIKAIGPIYLGLVSTSGNYISTFVIG